MQSTSDATIAGIALPAGGPGKLDGPRAFDLGVLGEAFEFIFDRVADFIGALGFGGSTNLAALQTAHQKLASALNAAQISLPDVKQLAAIAAPRDLLAALETAAKAVLVALRAAAQPLLELIGAGIQVARAVLDTRLYIPVVTDLIEKFILGRDLTLLNLLTLLAGAAYTVLFKLSTGSRSSPYKDIPAPRAFAARALRAEAAPPAHEAFIGSWPDDLEFPPIDPNRPQPPPTSHSDTRERKLTAIGLSSVGAAASLIGGLARAGSSDDRAKLVGSGLAIGGSVASLTATAVYTSAFDNWWPSELVYGLASLGSASATLLGDDAELVQMALGSVQSLTGAVTGLGLLSDGASNSEVVGLRMSSEILTGLANVASGDNEVKALLLTLMLGSRIALLGVQIDSL